MDSFTNSHLKQQIDAIVQVLLTEGDPEYLNSLDRISLLKALQTEVKFLGIYEPNDESAQRYANAYLSENIAPWHELISKSSEPLRTPFLGREHELELLYDILETKVKHGQGQIVNIVGEAGLGKSRILAEFRQKLKTIDVNYLEGQCRDYGDKIPYLPILDILRTSCGITESTSPKDIAASVRNRLVSLGLQVKTYLPYILCLFGDRQAIQQLRTFSRQWVKFQTFSSLLQMVLKGCEQRPLVLAIENLNWIDKTSQDILLKLIDRIREVPILLIVTHRLEYSAQWLDSSHSTSMPLLPLSREASFRIVSSILPEKHLGKELIERRELIELILDASAGNPFFLEELSQVAIDGNSFDLTRETPDTIQHVLAARIDMLPEDEKSLLQVCSVIGGDISLNLLKLLHKDKNTLNRLLQDLKRHEFIHKKIGTEETVYIFKHTLTREVAYSSLSLDDKLALHRKIVEAIESQNKYHHEDTLYHLAHHTYEGQIWDKAFEYFWKLATSAMSASAYQEAVSSFEISLYASDKILQNSKLIEQIIDIRLELRNALFILGELEKVLENLKEAEILSKSSRDNQRLCHVYADLANYFNMTGEPDKAILYGQRGLHILPCHSEQYLQVGVTYRLGRSYYSMGDYNQAMHFLKKNIAFLHGDLRYQSFGMTSAPSVLSRTVLVWCLTERGEFDDGIKYGQEGLRIAKTINQPLTRIVAYYGIGFLYLRKGEFDEAIHVLEKGLELCNTIPVLFPIIAGFLGSAYAKSGRFDEAFKLLESVANHNYVIARVVDQSLRMAFLGETYLMSDAIDHASRYANHALKLAYKHHERGNQAWCLWLIGQVAAKRGSQYFEQARSYYHQAMMLGDELGMKPLIALCHYGLGKLYKQHPEENATQLHTELSEAITLFRSMKMHAWLSDAEQTLRSA